MSQPISRLWFLGPPAAILISLLAYYAKFPSMRHWVDARFPWVEVNIGRLLPELVEESPTTASVPVRTSPPRFPTPITEPTPPQTIPAPPPPPAPPVAPSYLTADGAVDMQKLAV